MEFTFVSGHPALDLAGTVQHRRTDRRDLLTTPDDLSRWAAAAGLADTPPPADATALTAAVDLREAIYRLASAARTASATPVPATVPTTTTPAALGTGSASSRPDGAGPDGAGVSRAAAASGPGGASPGQGRDQVGGPSEAGTAGLPEEMPAPIAPLAPGDGTSTAPEGRAAAGTTGGHTLTGPTGRSDRLGPAPPPGSSRSAAAPGSALSAAAPGSALSAAAPGSALSAAGPGSALSAVAPGSALYAAADLRILNAAARRPPVTVSLGADGTVGRSGGIEAVLATVARAAVELLGGPLAARIRECGAPECTRLYVDTSRRQARRWCDMRECGNRAKAAAFRARHSAGPRPPD